MPHAGLPDRSQVVKSIPRNNPDFVLLDWLRPAPLSGEQLSCVCEVGDDPLANNNGNPVRSCPSMIPVDVALLTTGITCRRPPNM